MDTRYSRNRIYLSNEEQEIIKDFPVVLGGSGIGSVIAECALRFGFENITIIDGDTVELSNLNRQNYTEKDIDKYKTQAIVERLKAINSKANINYHNCFLTEDNVGEFIKPFKAAINALDFTTDVPLVFDKICQKNNIPVLHPYNIGWSGLVAVITKHSLSLDQLAKPGKKFNEVDMVRYVSKDLSDQGNGQEWIDDTINQYLNEKETLSPPQLSIGSWTVAAMCTEILFKIATNKEIKTFPDYYFSTML